MPVEFARCAGSRIFAERGLQITFDEPAFSPVHRRSADGNAGGNVLIANAGVGSQQDLRPFELTRGVHAAGQQRSDSELVAFGLAQFDSVTYIHRRPGG